MYGTVLPLVTATLQVPPVMPIDLTSLLAVGLGIMVVLIPITGVTARFALKPIAEAVARMREAQGVGKEVGLIEQRLNLLEQQMAGLETEVERLSEASDFVRQLRSGE